MRPALRRGARSSAFRWENKDNKFLSAERCVEARMQPDEREIYHLSNYGKGKIEAGSNFGLRLRIGSCVFYPEIER